MKVATLLILSVLSVGLAWMLLIPKSVPEGPRRIYSTSCGGSASVSLDLSVYRHFEPGDDIGWSLFYHPVPSISVPLYDEGFSAQDPHGASSRDVVSSRPASFVSPTYAPLPQPKDVVSEKIFDGHAVVREAFTAIDPQFMNIFINPQEVSQRTFEGMANCLSANRASLDEALSELGSQFPDLDGRSYKILKLGGIVYGFPPYRNSDYMRAVRKMRGATVIPEHGFFTLYRGQAAVGHIGGYLVRIALDEFDNTTLTADGKDVGVMPGISGSDGHWTIEGDGCIISVSHCGKSIMTIRRNDDFSYTYRVSVKLWDGSYKY